MEEGRHELEFDEFEMLLGEIPSATSAAPSSDESGLGKSSIDLKRVSLDDSLTFKGLSSTCVGNPKEPFAEKLQNTPSLGEGSLVMNKIKHSPVKDVQAEGRNLPDGQTMTNAFAELNFKDGAMHAASPNLIAYESLPTYTVLSDGKHPTNLVKSVFNLDSQVKTVPSPRSPNKPNAFGKFDAEKNGLEELKILKFNVQELKRQQVGCRTPVENISNGVPLNHGVHGFQILPNVAIAGMEYPIISDQQQYLYQTPSFLPYLPSQQMSQPQIAWRHMDEERLHRLRQQYLYLQQFRNRRIESQHPIQANGNMASSLVSHNPRQQYSGTPVSQHLEQPNQETFWNSAAIVKSLSHSNYFSSFPTPSVMQVLEKTDKQNFPEKLPMRANGLNSLKAVKFGSFREGESPTLVNQSGRGLSDEHIHLCCSSPNAGCFQFDGLRSRGSSPSGVDFNKHVTFRPQLHKYNSIDEVVGRIYRLAKDQHGCRFLQRKFTEGTTADIEKIFLEIIDHVVELMIDPFGNYLVQKLLEVCDENQLMQILHAVTRRAGELVRISCDMHGTRAVQKVIETLKTPEQFSLVVNALKPGVVTLIKNMNGNHVAQRCLQYLVPEYREFLFEAASSHCVELATDRHGCCVLQKCLTHSDGEQRHRLICEVSSNALVLSQDPFGNYVVQFVFELGLPWATNDVLDELEGNFADLSMQKYSSNVVEKCLKYAGEERRSQIIQELISNPRLDQIMQDPYGNYVIQAALSDSEGALHDVLIKAIKPHVAALRTSPYGKKVLSSNSLKK
ncbi:Pumilio RNA-binding repeat [Dillenia turbinata]|uniref:Pumilio RNA-binding repeat n=1 Tax=Dillenia turbinata TaxID=194707 RepID=A0AAN8V932_9MAGN